MRAAGNHSRDIPPVSMGASVDDFFAGIRESSSGGETLPNWHGELYLEVRSLTSQHLHIMSTDCAFIVPPRHVHIPRVVFDGKTLLTQNCWVNDHVVMCRGAARGSVLVNCVT